MERTGHGARLERRAPRRVRPRVADIVLAAVYASATGTILLWRLLYVGAPPRDVVPDAVVLVLATGSILVRRVRPAVLVPVASVLQVVAFGLQVGGEVLVAGLLAYAAAAWRSTAAGCVVAAASVLGALAGSAVLRLLVEDPARPARILTDLTYAALVCTIALLLGVAVGTRRRYVAALLHRTEELAAERDRSARLARAAERSRIAREMHDVLSHGLQLVISGSDAAVVVAERDPARAKELMTTVADTARRAMGEARTVFGLLREPGEAGDRAPMPGLTDLDGLVERLRGSGLQVVLEQRGAPALGDARELAVHRIVQEALTNALRHAGEGTTATVRIVHDAEGTSIRVEDDGRAAAARPSGDGSGIVGMEERAAAHGGSASAGPRVDAAGWVVQARIPAADAGGARG